MASRSRSRQFAVQLLYQYRMSGYELERVLQLYWSQHEIDPTTQAYAERIVRGVLADEATFDLEINQYLKHWSLDRIVKIDHIILQIAMYELMHETEIPWKVVVDEAVNLAHSFCSDKSVSFVNGVLHAWCETNREDVTT